MRYGPWASLATVAALTACQGTPQLGQGQATVTGSAGDAGAQSASVQLERCTRPIGTAALVEPEQQAVIYLRELNLESPLPVVRLIMQQSGCFEVIERGAATSILEAEQRRSGKVVRLKAADFLVQPNVISSNPNAGGYGGGLASIGSVFGPIGLLAGAVAGSISIKEAQATIFVTDVGTGVQKAAAEGRAKVTDFGGVGGLAGIGGSFGGLGAFGGYGKTAEGQLIAAALLDAHNNVVRQLRGTRVATGGGNDRGGARGDTELVRNIQAELQGRGFYNGRIDGQYGRGTRAAIIQYQNANSLVADGEPTEYLLRHMQRQG